MNEPPISIHINGYGTITAPDWETMKKYLRENPEIDPDTAEWIIKTRDQIRDEVKRKNEDRYR